MTTPAISARAIGKRYQIARSKRRDQLHAGIGGFVRAGGRALARIVRGREPIWPKSPRFWALDDVSFEIPRGQALGVIGRNGSGKSTLLKVLSRVTPPTRGEAVTVGRIGSLLEIGAGFHMELTGRENVFLSGAILGMKRGEIRSRFDEIVDFSGVSRFVDTPVKRYSSGMYLRLAFSVAAHLDTEILLVDEVLAVGDSAFQKNCLDKLSSLVRDGRTVMFVSHNLAAVSRICDQGLVLNEGRTSFLGTVANAIGFYEKMNTQMEEDDRSIDSGGARINNLNVLGPHGPADSAAGLTVEFYVVLPKNYWTVSVGFGIRTMDDVRMVFDVVDSNDHPRLGQRGKHKVRVHLPPLWLRPRTYVAQAKVTAYLTEGEYEKHVSDTFEFPVHGPPSHGLLDPHLQPPVEWAIADSTFLEETDNPQ